jgi:hypothetical protein
MFGKANLTENFLVKHGSAIYSWIRITISNAMIAEMLIMTMIGDDNGVIVSIWW